MNVYPWLSIVFILILSACGTPQTATPAPTPEAIYLLYPVSLQPWADRLSTCADNNPRIGLYFFPATQSQGTLLPDQVILELIPSQEEIKSASLYQVGLEQILVIINQANPLSQLSDEQIRSIFSGQRKNWDNGKPVQVWILPENDPVTILFDQSVMMTFPYTTEALLAPDPVAMLEAVSENTDAIGFLPASYLNSNGTVDPGTVAIVELSSELNAKLNQPVVAVTSGEPTGELRNLLTCLESATP